ncbi:uncharacterized protein IL334_003724 [Kwoniella shivajii]|uniref:Uncharacterized protein n=1 Tax=Kwoniella shivajii TaxID=564305 RepID=A0ABZ1CYC3_9TREE|nr:hypothetical protein IL334_003724 [Kwoniella shivajii]
MPSTSTAASSRPGSARKSSTPRRINSPSNAEGYFSFPVFEHVQKDDATTSKGTNEDDTHNQNNSEGTHLSKSETTATYNSQNSGASSTSSMKPGFLRQLSSVFKTK